MPTAVWALRWADVDPASHTFDRERVAKVVDAVMPSTAITGPRLGEKRQKLEDDVDRALIASEGPWIAGWRWTASEPGGGGIVRAYCCARDSLKGGPEKMRAAILGATADLRARLEDLAGLFQAWDRDLEGLDEGEAASRIASRLLPVVLEWTGAEDAWYSTFERTLAWALERRGLRARRAETLVHEAIGGRFESWLEPPEPTTRSVVEDLARQARREAEREPVDALATWLSKRDEIKWATQQRLNDPGSVTTDGHRRFIEEVDRARDSARATRLRKAVAEARADAQEGRRLTLERLMRWQRTVLGAPTSFRTTVAVAHGGAERYGLEPDTERRFAACIEEVSDPEIPPIARAARAYLDVCYFHPFPDGNGRAARLALDFVLTQAGLGLHAAGPVFLVARRAGDQRGPYGFMYIIDYLSGPIAWS